LRVANVNSPDLQFFFSYGQRTASAIADAAERHGRPISRVGSLLDFGCGCGRLLRNWNDMPDLRVCGSDLNSDAIAWLDAHLTFVEATRNGLEPPLPYGDAEFGLIYSISVFTHLTEKLGEAWMAELHRVLAPGGLLLFSVNGSTVLGFLTRRERAAFRRGEMVVQFKEAAGENICAAYHPEASVQRLTRAFERLECMPAASNGFVPQDVWVVRRPI
jgi:SAM-dependent methyltransferase